MYNVCLWNGDRWIAMHRQPQTIVISLLLSTSIIQQLLNMPSEAELSRLGFDQHIIAYPKDKQTRLTGWVSRADVFPHFFWRFSCQQVTYCTKLWGIVRRSGFTKPSLGPWRTELAITHTRLRRIEWLLKESLESVKVEKSLSWRGLSEWIEQRVSLESSNDINSDFTTSSFSTYLFPYPGTP